MPKGPAGDRSCRVDGCVRPGTVWAGAVWACNSHYRRELLDYYGYEVVGATSR